MTPFRHIVCAQMEASANAEDMLPLRFTVSTP